MADLVKKKVSFFLPYFVYESPFLNTFLTFVKIAKLQEEIDLAVERSNTFERNFKQQEVLVSKLEQELRSKDSVIASLEEQLQKETIKRQEAEQNYNRLNKELLELSTD